jgi:ATP-dependent DNA helicase RecQ
LKILEQEELLYFNEQVFIQSRVQVIASRQRLIDFENEQPELEILLKHLLRSYEGILDHQVNINEKSVSFVLKKPVEVIIEHLNKLHNYHIIDYAPKK